MAWCAGLSLLRALGPWPRRLGPVLLLQRHRVALASGLASTLLAASGLAAVECSTERGRAREQLLRAVWRGEAAEVGRLLGGLQGAGWRGTDTRSAGPRYTWPP